MSMHKIPLTPIEEAGLRAHGLDIGTPSQLSDAFRQGVRYGRAQPIQGGEAVEVVAYRGKDPDGGEGFVGARWPDAFGEDCIVERLMTVAQHQRILAAATAQPSPDAELVELLREVRELIEHGDFREGHCMCGSAVESHGFGDGHSPVDAGVYYAGQVMERIDAKLASLKGVEE